MSRIFLHHLKNLPQGFKFSDSDSTATSRGNPRRTIDKFLFQQRAISPTLHIIAIIEKDVIEYIVGRQGFGTRAIDREVKFMGSIPQIQLWPLRLNVRESRNRARMR